MANQHIIISSTIRAYTAFPQIYEMLKQYVSSFYLAQVEQQMAEAMLYRAKQITVEDALQVHYYHYLFVNNIMNNLYFLCS